MPLGRLSTGHSYTPAPACRGVVLVVEDEPDLQQAFTEGLKSEGFHVESAASVFDALVLLRAVRFDVVLTDYALGRHNGIEMLASARAERLLDIGKFVLLVRSDGTEVPVAETCAPIRDAHGRVTGSVLVLRDMTKEKLRQDRLETLSLLDPLTGIANRRALELRIAHEVVRAARYKHPLSCLMADIDGFKAINDTLGHAIGDSVLAAVAGLLPLETRAGVDLVARYGGEEFVVILPETSLEGAVTTAQRVRRRIAMTEMGPPGLQVTVSIGVASGATEDLVARADRAMYLAKRNGRNRVEVWDDATCAAAPPRGLAPPP